MKDIREEKSVCTSINLEYLSKKAPDVNDIHFKPFRKLQHQSDTILPVPGALERRC